MFCKLPLLFEYTITTDVTQNGKMVIMMETLDLLGKALT